MDNEKYIWDFLLSVTNSNKYGTAGMMGNLYAESALNPRNLQNTYEKKLCMTDDEYTRAVDVGTYKDFCSDRAGYGLAQWTSESRKTKLFIYAGETGRSVGDLGMQLAFLFNELVEDYPSVLHGLKYANNVREASDLVLTKFEKPKNQSGAVKQKRAAYGEKFLEKYGNTSSGADAPPSVLHPQGGGKKVVRMTANVNIRYGNGTEYARLATVGKGSEFEYVGIAVNGWYAIKFGSQIMWVSGDYSEVVEK